MRKITDDECMTFLRALTTPPGKPPGIVMDYIVDDLDDEDRDNLGLGPRIHPDLDRRRAQIEIVRRGLAAVMNAGS